MKNLLHWAPLASGFIVLVLSLGVVFLTVASRNQPVSTSTKAVDQPATLALSPAMGQPQSVGIVLNSAGKSVDGADVVINFDPKMVQVVGNSVASTALFEQAPLNSVDNVAGKIKFSVLTFSPRPVTGIIGTFAIKPVSTGTANFTFDFTPGKTTDSNIADHASAKDILGAVTNGSYTFK
ncbi:MAG: hypothetical protein M1484_02085 [Patescibacteria group bacterium]|nr:hypothetical protein [Patescibacteria group bacterium]MCL5431870.1 hypothetical protein [Patescibacteria group bacterium]